MHGIIQILIIPDDDYVNISFNLKEKPFNLRRLKCEGINKTLNRIKLVITKNSKNKKEENGSIKLMYENLCIDHSILSNADWRSGFELIYSKNCFIVDVNPPTIINLNVFNSNLILLGFPLIIDTVTIYSDGVEYEIFKQEKCSTSESVYENWNRVDSSSFAINKNIFTPIDETLVNCRLKIYAVPYKLDNNLDKIYNKPFVLYLKRPLISPNVIIPYTSKIREELYSSIAMANNNRIVRVLSYNILSSFYPPQRQPSSSKTNIAIDDDSSIDCFDIEYRVQLILKELIASNSDIICLQECDRSVYDKYLNLYFKTIGYTGCYTNKASGVAEGCALFIASNNLKIHGFINIAIKEIACKSDPDMYRTISRFQELHELICEKLGTICQIAVISSIQSPSSFSLVVNTHLYYHPTGDFIRLLQIYFIISLVNTVQFFLLKEGIEELSKYFSGNNNQEEEAECMIRNLFEYKAMQEDYFPLSNSNNAASKSSSSSSSCGVILCGDLNSTPHTAVIKYLLG